MKVRLLCDELPKILLRRRRRDRAFRTQRQPGKALTAKAHLPKHPGYSPPILQFCGSAVRKHRDCRFQTFTSGAAPHTFPPHPVCLGSRTLPAIPPPLFLQCPGVPPISWKTWRCVVQVYVDAVVPGATPDTKKALLLNALVVEELQAYYKAADVETLLDGVQASGDGATSDAYPQAFAVLDAYFAPPIDDFCVLARFRWRVQ
ncbi:hypothetical protein HPB51_027668 [Rhipicephalus microplus]|uniref:Uncharacterized protein n=1 Tax=Rhipicephalus microplus TaxID=6941 RepID=A0A9J6CZT0_RHIMP|nr:hypothetical protein HPB51_027668 [Rhipicephalus microplus]